MRALSLHPDVVVVTSSVWQTSATLVRGPGEMPESVLVDSPILPVELDALRGLADSGGFDVRGHQSCRTQTFDHGTAIRFAIRLHVGQFLRWRMADGDMSGRPRT